MILEALATWQSRYLQQPHLPAWADPCQDRLMADRIITAGAAQTLQDEANQAHEVLT